MVVAFDISCGSCFFCDHGYQSSCDTTNPSKVRPTLCDTSTRPLQAAAAPAHSALPLHSCQLAAAAGCQDLPGSWVSQMAASLQC